MSAPVLAPKLYIPSPPPKLVLRPRLSERLNAGVRHKLILISAPAGFGKSTLVSEWVAALTPSPLPPEEGSGVRAAWLSLDEGDNDPTRFLTYLVAAVQTVAPPVGAGVLAALQSPQQPLLEPLLTTLLNEIAAVPEEFVLVLDDYHVVDAKPVNEALAFLLEHLPPQMHLVIATREDPPLPLARLRARGQLTELRAADLRFTPAEAAEFLNQAMGLSLSAENIAALETRTEGWIAGLQLAALSMQGHPDATGFIKSFTGSHHFVLDYLVEEVLEQQVESTQTFLLHTSILDRVCGPLCDAVLLAPSASGQETLEALEHANLFIVPLDNERCWYRYHHLFGDLLRQRLGQRLTPEEIAELHIRASEWCEKNDLVFEAFRHATAAGDTARAERLLDNRKLNLYFRSVVMPVLDWLGSLPPEVLDSHPSLWVRSATLALMTGQTSGVEEKLQAAEKALQGAERDEKIHDLIGQIACARATLALTHYDLEAMVLQAHRALEYLHPENLTFRFNANWALATAFRFQGDRVAAARACQESIAISQKSGQVFSKILATSALGELQELDNQLQQAAETYQQTLELSGEHPQPFAGEVHLSLARIHYQWNDLESAERHGVQSLELTRRYDRGIDRFVVGEVFLAQLKLARGDVEGAARALAQTEHTARQNDFTQRLPEIAAAQVQVLLKQTRLSAAAELARRFELPLSQARVLLAQDDPSAALAVLAPFRQQMEAKGWADKRLRAMVLQAVALHSNGEKDKAVLALNDALALAEPGGFIRLFVDEGEPMRWLILDFQSWIDKQSRDRAHPQSGYVNKLLTAFGQIEPESQSEVSHRKSTLVEPLSQRELEVLRLIDQGLSNQAIGERLFLALSTVKGHNRNIFDKLQVQSRTEAIARARELGLL